MPDFESILQTAIQQKNFRNLEPESEEDAYELYDAFCEAFLPDIPKDRLETIKRGFLTDLLEYGLNENNPFVLFIRKILPITSMTLDQYMAISELYKDRELEAVDLKGQSIDGFKHIIFNPELYKIQNINDFNYMIQVWDWCQETYNIRQQLNIIKVLKYYNDLKSIEDVFAFRDDVFYTNMPELIKKILESKQAITYKDVNKNSNWGMFKKSGSFNSADQVEKNLEALHGSEIASNKQTSQPEEKASKLQDWKKGLDQVVTENNLEEAIYALLLSYTLDDAKYSEIKKALPNLPEEVNFKTIQKWRRTFSQLNIDNRNINEVLKYLSAKGKQ